MPADSWPRFTRALGSFSDTQKDAQWGQRWQYSSGPSPYSCVRAASCVSCRKSHFLFLRGNDTCLWGSVHRPTSERVGQGKLQKSRFLTRQAMFRRQLHPAFERDWGSALRSCMDASPPLRQSHVRDTELPPRTWPSGIPINLSGPPESLRYFS